jgi:hypothetical protein
MITGIHALLYSKDADATRTLFRDVLGFSGRCGSGVVDIRASAGGAGDSSRRDRQRRNRALPHVRQRRVDHRRASPERCGDRAARERPEMGPSNRDPASERRRAGSLRAAPRNGTRAGGRTGDGQVCESLTTAGAASARPRAQPNEVTRTDGLYGSRAGSPLSPRASSTTWSP